MQCSTRLRTWRLRHGIAVLHLRLCCPYSREKIPKQICFPLLQIAFNNRAGLCAESSTIEQFTIDRHLPNTSESFQPQPPSVESLPTQSATQRNQRTTHQTHLQPCPTSRPPTTPCQELTISTSFPTSCATKLLKQTSTPARRPHQSLLFLQAQRSDTLSSCFRTTSGAGVRAVGATRSALFLGGASIMEGG
jgi:hypothetical protein